MDVVTSVAQLVDLYPEPNPRALEKEVPHLTALQRKWIEASPFVLVATAGPGGLDCSPRGDPAPVVTVVDERTLQLPDRRGNNRLDTLRNIVEDGRIGLLFLVPGLGVTLRVNGTAVLRIDPAVREQHSINGTVPVSVIEITVHAAYTQCPKALIRSDIWNSERFKTESELPTVGQILEEISGGDFDGDAWDADYPRLVEETIY